MMCWKRWGNLMRRDYLEQIRDRGSKHRPLKIQMVHNRYYRGKYNGKLFEPLREVLIWKHEPMPKLLVSTWGGSGKTTEHGVAFAGCRYDRQVYRLDRGRYWVRGKDTV